MTKIVTIHEYQENFDYCHTPFDAIDIVLCQVNKFLKDNNVDICFEVNEFDGELPDEMWDEKHPNYTGNITVEEK